MSFYFFLLLFLPVGVLVLWSPKGLVDRYKGELMRLGLPGPLLTAMAVGWILVGLAALLMIIHGVFGAQ
ncbi:hypothetical protein AN221_02210 [Streptomyces nanshensis]|uniref:Uncharacterized protein n=1 Tax=Streptomyces nanshensis TaxID=518642 RepID=A0A1E7M306_9ACTN|nr:hypothetical protein AN221_02210 [Streptomyces nanshensis]